MIELSRYHRETPVEDSCVHSSGCKGVSLARPSPITSSERLEGKVSKKHGCSAPLSRQKSLPHLPRRRGPRATTECDYSRAPGLCLLVLDPSSRARGLLALQVAHNSHDQAIEAPPRGPSTRDETVRRYDTLRGDATRCGDARTDTPAHYICTATCQKQHFLHTLSYIHVDLSQAQPPSGSAPRGGEAARATRRRGPAVGREAVFQTLIVHSQQARPGRCPALFASLVTNSSKFSP